MIVVADTSPLNYLIQLDQIQLLQLLYGKVLVPPEVIEELRHPAASGQVQTWAAALPPWVVIRTSSVSLHPELHALDKGERAAAAVALEFKADLLLLDDLEARIAVQRHLMVRTMGLLGVLREAQSRRLLDAKEVFARLLNETSFRCSATLKQRFLETLDL